MTCFSIEVNKITFNSNFDFPEKLILASSVLIFRFQESLNRIPSPFLVDESQLDLSGFEKFGKRFRQYRLEERVLFLSRLFLFSRLTFTLSDPDILTQIFISKHTKVDLFCLNDFTLRALELD